MLITKCYNLPGTPNSQQNVSTIFAMQFSWRLTNLANVILQRERSASLKLQCMFKISYRGIIKAHKKRLFSPKQRP